MKNNRGKISEVFDSIQGEGLYVGERQIFVRFYGCNLTCRFCDTRPEQFMEYEPAELLGEIELHRRSWHQMVAFTGGEPLMQKDFLKEIMRLVKGQGLRNYLETNGTLPQALEEVIDYADIISMDLKLPSSADMAGFWQEHRKFFEIASRKEVFVKAVISKTTTKDDLWQALGLMREINRAAILVLQPDSSEDSAQLEPKVDSLRDLCALEGITSCVIPQMHKVIGVR